MIVHLNQQRTTRLGHDLPRPALDSVGSTLTSKRRSHPAPYRRPPLPLTRVVSVTVLLAGFISNSAVAVAVHVMVVAQLTLKSSVSSGSFGTCRAPAGCA